MKSANFDKIKENIKMNLVELLFIAVGLSMDAFAVSICIGLSMQRAELKKSLIVGIYFGFFQAVMPLIGYLLGSQFADKIVSLDHWIAFLLLGFIGGKMIKDSFSKEVCQNTGIVCQNIGEVCPVTGEVCSSIKKESACTEEVSLKFEKMFPLALATSIDALAIGVSFAFLKVDIIPAVSFIGITTLLLSMGGVKIGNVFGEKFKSKAELAGGIILILIGLKILLEHTRILTL